jgi:hypothetical protein
MTYRETVVHGHVSSQHLVQLFDSADSLADAVAGFLRQGFLEDDALLVVIARQHWNAVAEQLRATGVAIDAATASGQLVVRDSADTLKSFMRRGSPDRDLFDASVGSLVRQQAARGGRLRVYGDMVDLLAAEAEFNAAQVLENLWNELGERESMTLFCGYAAVHFGDPRTAEALRLICRSHSHVRSNPQDVLGSFLLDSQAALPHNSSAPLLR